MAATEIQFFDRALARISKSMLALAMGGAAAVFAWRGWTWGAGFLAGAAASWLNFFCLKNIVDALGRSRPTRKRTLALAGLRYLLLGAGAYAILIYTSISIVAALLGLFVSAAAVIVEILFELVYAPN